VVTPRERRVSIASAANYPAGGEIKSGIYVAVCKGGYGDVLDTALSTYVRAGVLPESQVGSGWQRSRVNEWSGGPALGGHIA
jgi:hypothetical protein